MSPRAPHPQGYHVQLCGPCTAQSITPRAPVVERQPPLCPPILHLWMASTCRGCIFTFVHWHLWADGSPWHGWAVPSRSPLAPGSSAFPSFTRDLPSHLCVTWAPNGRTDHPPPQDDSLPPSPHPRPPALSTPSKGSRPEHPRGFQEDALPLAPESSPTYSRPRRCSSDPDRALPHPCFSQGLFARGGPCRSPTSSECLRACP